MKKTIIYSTLVGAFVGILMSAILLVLNIGSEWIYWLSLSFIVDSINFSNKGDGFIFLILFTILVYSLYGFIIGLIISKYKKK